MPYSNVSKSKWDEMERCVADVKAKGNTKNPYAICYSSIMGEKLAKRHAKKHKK